MKKLLTAIALGLCLIGAAQAQHRPGHYGGYYNGHRGGSGIGWFVPALITGAIVYGATRQVEQVPQPLVIVDRTPPPQPTPVCPIGSVATYVRAYVQLANGQFVETYSFVGCKVEQ